MALSEKAEKVVDAAGSKKAGKSWKAKKVSAVAEDEVTDKVSARQSGKDVPLPVAVIDIPRIVADLEQNGNQSLDEGEPIIEIGPVNCPPSWRRVQGIDWRTLKSKLSCSMCFVLPLDNLIQERAERTLIQQSTSIIIVADAYPS